MKRWTLRILLMLILGVVTTLVVAWALAFISGQSRSTLWAVSDRGGILGDSSRANNQFVQRYRRNVISRVPNDMELDNTIVSGFEMMGLEVVSIDAFRESRWGAQVQAVRNGWPMRATEGSSGESYDWRDEAWQIAEPWGSGTLPANDRRLLAWRPILPGFIINTLLYAAIWFVLFFGFSALRRTIRRKRGRCVRCGYDLRGALLPSPSGRGAGGEGQHGCSECGWGR